MKCRYYLICIQIDRFLETQLVDLIGGHLSLLIFEEFENNDFDHFRKKENHKIDEEH